MTERLFDLDEVPEVPLFREPRRSRGERDGRFRNDYPPEWKRCPTCEGTGKTLGLIVAEEPRSNLHEVEYVWSVGGGTTLTSQRRNPVSEVGTYLGFRRRNVPCADCLGMGSLVARVRLEAGHRCLRCKHPYIPKGDAKMLGVEPSFESGGWSPCDERCRHGGPVEAMNNDTWIEIAMDGYDPAERAEAWHTRRAIWRILTVHHLDGDKANCRWWNLAALCQVCHLHIQHKVVMERVYPYPHTEWFRPYVAGYYAWVYNGEDLSREQTMARLDELLALELITA